jgi:hypothetical protein
VNQRTLFAKNKSDGKCGNQGAVRPLHEPITDNAVEEVSTRRSICFTATQIRKCWLVVVRIAKQVRGYKTTQST